jgi:transcriptional regulator with XRE-family HTH domain
MERVVIKREKMDEDKKDGTYEDFLNGVYQYAEPKDGADFLTDPEAIDVSEAEREKEVQLGEKIKLARKKRGLSIKGLSIRTGIDIETLNQVEENQFVPPLGELIKLGKALAMKMGSFISTGEAPFTVVRSDQRKAISRFGTHITSRLEYYYESLAADKKDRFMEPFMVTLPPTDIEELSQHDGQEFIYVLEGEMEVHIGEGYRDVLRPGDAVYYDSTTPHLVKAHGDTPAKILAVLYT